jgi:hypothetical protein
MLPMPFGTSRNATASEASECDYAESGVFYLGFVACPHAFGFRRRRHLLQDKAQAQRFISSCAVSAGTWA